MTNIDHDEKGFTCECGLRNDYPGYVQAHWTVKLAYSCSPPEQAVYPVQRHGDKDLPG